MFFFFVYCKNIKQFHHLKRSNTCNPTPEDILKFTFDDLFKFQCCPNLFVEVDKSKVNDFNDMLVIEITNWNPIILNMFLSCIY